MGINTDRRIQAWQEKAGIEPATGKDAADLRELSKRAFELIKVIELELSGIRDGDGRWHGSDAMGGTLSDIAELCNRILERQRQEFLERLQQESRLPEEQDASF
jgi:hypothetical protein